MDTIRYIGGILLLVLCILPLVGAYIAVISEGSKFNASRNQQIIRVEPFGTLYVPFFGRLTETPAWKVSFEDGKQVEMVRKHPPLIGTNGLIYPRLEFIRFIEEIAG